MMDFLTGAALGAWLGFIIGFDIATQIGRKHLEVMKNLWITSREKPPDGASRSPLGDNPT
jgi:surfactin synthase thioesterase subunit